jgi:glycosyltransferase involved in cell wall biosynthesis
MTQDGNPPNAGLDVTVIVPTFNRLHFLKRAVDSCRSTRCRTEVIIVDDGSTDGTWEWLQSQPDLIRLRQKNQGQGWAVLNGFKLSQGRFVRFLDSDDFLAQGAIDQQWTVAQETGADIVYGAVDRHEESTGAVLPEPDPEQWDDFMAVQLGERNGSHYLGMLFKRELFDAVPVRRPEYGVRDDRMLLLELALLNPKVARSPGVAGYWSKHAAQMHTSCRGLALQVANWQMLQIYKKTLSALEARHELTARRTAAACNVLWPLALAIARAVPHEGVEVERWIRQLHPGFCPPESGLRGWCFRHLGFAWTQRLFRVARLLRAVLGYVKAGCSAQSLSR